MRGSSGLLVRSVVVGFVGIHLSLTSVTQADVVFHNGTVATSGDGSVNVDFFWINSPGGLLFGTAFHEVTAHSFLYEYDSGSEPPVFLAEFAISNETASPWNTFYVSLLQADFYGVNGGVPGGPLARTANPVVLGGSGADEVAFGVNTGSATLAGSSIFRDTVNSVLQISFLDAVDPGESFAIAFFVDVSSAGQGPQFLLSQSPVATAIPSPTSAALGLPALALCWLRRRRASESTPS